MPTMNGVYTFDVCPGVFGFTHITIQFSITVYHILLI